MLYTIFLIVYILVSTSLILVVLLQASRGGGLAASLGGMSSFGSSLFGGRGAADFLTKTTAVLAVLFVVLCLLLNALSPKSSQELRSATLRERERQERQRSPAAVLPSSEVEPEIPFAGGDADSLR